VWMTVWYVFIPPCIPDSHPHRVTNIRCRIDTVISPDDGNFVNKTNLVHTSFLLCLFLFSTFRANMCPSSGDITVSIRHLVFVTLCGWPSGVHNRRSSTLHFTYFCVAVLTDRLLKRRIYLWSGESTRIYCKFHRPREALRNFELLAIQ
jgi:hypothetical protein